MSDRRYVVSCHGARSGHLGYLLDPEGAGHLFGWSRTHVLESARRFTRAGATLVVLQVRELLSRAPVGASALEVAVVELGP